MNERPSGPHFLPDGLPIDCDWRAYPQYQSLVVQHLLRHRQPISLQPMQVDDYKPPRLSKRERFPPIPQHFTPLPKAYL